MILVYFKYFISKSKQIDLNIWNIYIYICTSKMRTIIYDKLNKVVNKFNKYYFNSWFYLIKLYFNYRG